MIRSEKEENEEEEEEEITIPSVDNIELLRRKTKTHSFTLLPVNGHLIKSFVLFSGFRRRGDEQHRPFLHRALLLAGLHLPHHHRYSDLQSVEREQTQALLLMKKLSNLPDVDCSRSVLVSLEAVALRGEMLPCTSRGQQSLMCAI